VVLSFPLSFFLRYRGINKYGSPGARSNSNSNSNWGGSQYSMSEAGSQVRRLIGCLEA